MDISCTKIPAFPFQRSEYPPRHRLPSGTLDKKIGAVSLLYCSDQSIGGFKLCVNKKGLRRKGIEITVRLPCVS